MKFHNQRGYFFGLNALCVCGTIPPPLNIACKMLMKVNKQYSINHLLNFKSLLHLLSSFGLDFYVRRGGRIVLKKVSGTKTCLNSALNHNWLIVPRIPKRPLIDMWTKFCTHINIESHFKSVLNYVLFISLPLLILTKYLGEVVLIAMWGKTILYDFYFHCPQCMINQKKKEHQSRYNDRTEA